MQTKLKARADFLATAAALVAALAGCAAQPENPDAGTCSLSCSSPRVGAAEFSVKPMEEVTQNTTVACQGAGIADAAQPTMVRWLITEQIQAFPGGGTTSGSTTGGTTGSTASGLELFGNTNSITQEPVAGVAFEPFIEGVFSINNTNAEFKPNGSTTTATPARFLGVVTPSSEWCSDSCGVISYEFWPMCLGTGTNQIQASVFAGGADVSAAAYNFSISAAGSN